MTLRGKLLLAQAPLAIALAVVGLVAVTTIADLGNSAQDILKDNYRSVLASQRMNEAIERIDSMLVLRVTGSGSEGADELGGLRRRFESELGVEAGNITEPGETDAVTHLRAAWEAYQAPLDRLLAATTPDAARALYFATLEPAFWSVKAPIDEILALNQDAMVLRSDGVQRTARRANTVTVLAAVGAVLVGLLMSATLTTRLLRPVSVLSLAVRRLGQGDLEARAQVAGGDEIAALAGEFNTMAERLTEYRRSSLGELLQAQQAAQAAIDSLPDPVATFDGAGALVSTNDAAERLLALTLEAEAGDPLARLDPDVRAVIERVRAHVLAGKGAWVPRDFDEAVRIGTGEQELWLLARGTPVYGVGSGIVGVTVVLQDVTRLRRFDELKNDLVSTVAHEVRTPLTSLRMAIHLCAEEAAGPLTEKQADLLFAAREDTERLQAIVRDLLDLSRIQAGRLELHRRRVALAEVFAAAVGAHRHLAEEAGVTLTAVTPTDLPELEIDAERIQVVLSNLITNGARHTPGGGSIELRARRDGAMCRIEVEDTGRGIPPEHVERVFDKFYRVPGAATAGAGVGLYIAKEIVTAHGGEIGIESTMGRGTLVWVTIPTIA